MVLIWTFGAKQNKESQKQGSHVSAFTQINSGWHIAKQIQPSTLLIGLFYYF